MASTNLTTYFWDRRTNGVSKNKATIEAQVDMLHTALILTSSINGIKRVFNEFKQRQIEIPQDLKETTKGREITHILKKANISLF